jgi:thioredoxin reductase (NADPH)
MVIGGSDSTRDQALIAIVDRAAPDDGLLPPELDRRFGRDYEVVAAVGAAAGLEVVKAAARSSRRVAVVIVPMWMPDMTGVDFLIRVRDLHPAAKRVLVIDVGDVSAEADIVRALTRNLIDFYFGMPWASPEEELYPVIGEALRLWSRQNQPRYEKAVIIEARDQSRGRELRGWLERNGVATGLVDMDSPRGRALLDRHRLGTDQLPAVVLYDGQVLQNPRRDNLAEALGASTRPRDGTYDVAIVGAGPAGLAAAVYAASEGLSAVVVESEAIGGQAGTSSKIRNYLGFPWNISGAELGERAARQAQQLGVHFVVARAGRGLRASAAQRLLTLSNGDEVAARAVVLAGGVAYRRLGVTEVDALVGAGVFYGAAVSEAQSMADMDVYVLGGGNSAGQAATHMAAAGARVTMLIRGKELSSTMSDYLIEEIRASDTITVRTGVQIVGAQTALRLETLVLSDADAGGTSTVRADALFVFIGARPHTEWLTGAVALDSNGFVLTGRDLSQLSNPVHQWQLERPPSVLETSMPGVFAAGDIRHRSVKRVAAAVGEGSTAILLVREYLESG